jgi:MerR family transcriptional regulator, copper efflux regulator
MLISEFAREAGLTPDTVRFYIRRGLLDPQRGERGGSARYQIFGAAHVERARLIRLAQSLGFTLREIAALSAEFENDSLSDERLVAILRGRLRDLDEKAAEIGAMAGYLRQKLRWIEGGRLGPEPALEAHGAQDDAISACAFDMPRQIPAPPAAEKSSRRRDFSTP